MAVDPELLAILVCPKTKGPLELVDLDLETRRALVEKYREKFRDEEPVVTQGLYSKSADLMTWIKHSRRPPGRARLPLSG